MFPPPLPRRQPAVATRWLMVACGLFATGCGQTTGPTATATRPAATAGDTSLRLFPSGPGSERSSAAATVVPRSARPLQGPAGSAPRIASFPSFAAAPARVSPAAKPSLRTAERLDDRATTVR